MKKKISSGRYCCQRYRWLPKFAAQLLGAKVSAERFSLASEHKILLFLPVCLIYKHAHASFFKWMT